MVSKPNTKVEEKLTNISMKISEQIHLRSLRDGMSILMPLFILAGIAILINFVVLPYIVDFVSWLLPGSGTDALLAKLQVWGNVLQNGSLNITGLLMAPCIGYAMAKNRKYANPISAAIMSLVAFIIMMPLQLDIIPNGQQEAVSISGVFSTTNLGTKAMFAGIIIGLLATELYVKLSKIKRLKITLGANVPPMVAQSFSTMFPAMITLALFAMAAAIFNAFGTDLISMIFQIVQEPLRKINTSLIGYFFIYSVGNLLFTLGIHQSVVSGTLTEPFLLSNMNDNMAAFTDGTHIPHIITTAFQAVYPQMGGTGATISLILAIFLFSKNKASKDMGKLSLAPGIFEINEPLIFGYPIVYNLPLIIPFISLPIINGLIGYFATAIGWVSHTVVMIPWITPPLISGYLSTAGDWRTVVLQALLIFMGAFIYLPFMKISERVNAQMAEQEKKEA